MDTTEKFGIPRKIIEITKEMYNNFSCRVIRESEIPDPFIVNTGVRKGCIISPIIFLILMDDVMKSVISGKERNIQWGLADHLKGLDFTDDICLLSQTYNAMDGKLKISKKKPEWLDSRQTIKKTKLMKVNRETTNY